MKQARGFTLIERVIVIVILGFLATISIPKFINVKSDAQASVVAATGSAFKSVVVLAHEKYLAGGYNGPVDNLDLYDTGGTSLMDMNSNGWPAQSWLPFEANPQLNNTADCISIWEAVLNENSPTVSTNSDRDYRVI